MLKKLSKLINTEDIIIGNNLDKFDIKKFHNYALKMGPMGLDRLKNEMSKWNGK